MWWQTSEDVPYRTAHASEADYGKWVITLWYVSCMQCRCLLYLTTIKYVIKIEPTSKPFSLDYILLDDNNNTEDSIHPSAYWDKTPDTSVQCMIAVSSCHTDEELQ